MSCRRSASRPLREEQPGGRGRGEARGREHAAAGATAGGGRRRCESRARRIGRRRVYATGGRPRSAQRPVNAGGPLLARRPATPSRKSPDAAISCWIVGLELELLVHAREQPGVELALGAGVGARRARRRAARPSASTSAVERVVGDDAVDQAPLERLRRRDALAEHRHLGRAREADARRARSSDEPPSGTRPMFTKASRK